MGDWTALHTVVVPELPFSPEWEKGPGDEGESRTSYTGSGAPVSSR